MSQTKSALETGQAKLWIVLIGVNQYYDRRLPSLEYSEADCQSLAEALTDATRPFPHCTIAVHHDSATLPPTIGSVRSSLENVVEQAQPQDTVLVYFCGQSALESRFQQAILCLADTERDQLLKTGLSLMSLLGLLGNCAAKQQIVWLDVYHGNGIKFSEVHGEEIFDDSSWQLIEILQQRVAQNPGFQVLLSCDRAQRSWKFPELGHSVFTHFLVQGLQGKAANAQGMIEFDAIAKFVQAQTQQYLNQTNQQLKWLHQVDESTPLKYFVQTPKRLGRSTNPVVLGVKPPDLLELAAAAPRTVSQPERIGIPTFQPSEVAPQPEQIETLEAIPPLIEETPVESIEEIALVEAATLPEIVEPVASEWVEPEPANFEVVPSEVAEPISSEFIESELPEPELIESEPTNFEVVSSEIAEPISFEVIETEPELIESEPTNLEVVSSEVAEPISSEVIESEPELIEPEPIEFVPNSVDEFVDEAAIAADPPDELVSEAAIVEEPVLEEPIEPEPISSNLTSESIAAPTPEPPTVEPVVHVRSLPKVEAPTRSRRRRDPDQLVRYRRQIQQATQTGAQQFASTVQTSTRQMTSAMQIGARQVTSAMQTGAHQVASTTDALKLSAQQLANTSGELCRKGSSQISQAAIAAVHQVSESVRQWTQAGQTFYRDRNAQLRESSTKKATALNQSARQIIQSVAEQSRRSQTRNLLGIALGGCGVAALGLGGFTLYQQRETQIRELQTLIASSQTQLASDQIPDALVTALKAGKSFQSLDRPWNFLSSDTKVNLSATLQQAIMKSTGQFSATLENKFANASLSSDQKTFAVTTTGNEIQLWQREDNQLQRLNTTFKGHEGKITQIRFSPDGKFLASASEDKTIKVWNIEKGILVRTLTGHSDRVTALEFRSDGGVLATGGADQTIRLWSVANGNLLDTLKDNTAIVTVIRFSPDGRILATGSNDNVIRVWYPDSNKPILLGRHDASSKGGITDLAFSSDGKTIASASGDSTTKLWTVSDAKSEQAATARATLTGHTGTVTSLSFSPTSDLLVSGSQDKTIKLWNLQNNTAIATLTGHQDSVTSLAFDSSGKTLLSGSDRNGLIQWSLDLPTLMEQGCNLIYDETATNPPEIDNLCQR